MRVSNCIFFNTAQVVMGLGEIGLDLERFNVTSNRFVKPAKFFKCITKVVMRFGKAGFDL